MKFVNDTPMLPKEEIDALIKDEDQLGIEETKQADEPKQVKSGNEKDMVTMTLVNLREKPDKNAKVLGTIKGGEVVLAHTVSGNGYTRVKYKNEEGYVANKYLR